MSPQHFAQRAATLVLAASASTAGLGAVSVTAIAETPSSTGCPTAYAPLSVEWLESQGPYLLPRQLDEAGNQDGVVCGKRLEDHAAANFCGGTCSVPIYEFSDNTRTPAYRN